MPDSEMRNPIVVTGSLAFDSIMDFPGRFAEHILPDKIHLLNLSFTVGTLKKQFGGTAGNIAYNLALLGEKPVIIGAAGYDFTDYRTHLKKAGVETSKIRIFKNTPTASFFVVTDLADNQIGGFYPGPMEKDLPVDFSTWKQKPALLIIAANNPPLMMCLAADSRREKIPFIFDPAQQIIRLSKDNLLSGLKGAKILIGNDYEMELIQSKTGWDKRRLLHSVSALITTKGEKGSLIEVPGQSYEIPPAKPLVVIDPTGAGDAYRAGLILGLINGWPWEKTGRAASLSAVYAVEKYGTQKHRYTYKDFRRRFRQNFGCQLEEE